MEPVTHVLTGACLARTGLNRRAAYATAAMAVAAEFPDIDTLWGLHGPVVGFEHHRGITHTLVGLPFEAGFLLLCFVALHSLRARRGRHPEAGSPASLTAAPVRWPVLYLLLLLALASHLLLDYTNNYGLRPFFPFDPHWYAASIVFIFDPLLLLLLVAGLALPSLFALIGQEVGARKRPFLGAGWARAALIALVALWGLRWYEHGQALALAATQTLRAPAQPGPALPAETSADGFASAVSAPARPLLRPVLSLASPDPLSPFRWYTVTDFGPAYRLGLADTRSESLVSEEILTKAAPTPALLAAEASHLGRVYLDWSPMPWITVSADGQERPAAVSLEQTVTFHDPRFMGSSPLLHRSSTPPLTGSVTLDVAGHVLEQALDGHVGR